jgi:hypothetical protein
MARTKPQIAVYPLHHATRKHRENPTISESTTTRQHTGKAKAFKPLSQNPNF